MTTSLNTADLSGAGGTGTPAGFPDPAVLAQLANQFFRAVPGTPSGGGAGGADVGAPQSSLQAASPAPLPGGFPGEGTLAAAGQGVPTPSAAPSPVSAPASVQAGLPGFPGGSGVPTPGFDPFSPSIPSPTELTRGAPSLVSAASPSQVTGAPQRNPEGFLGLPGFPNVAAPFSPTIPGAPGAADIKALLQPAPVGGAQSPAQLPAQSANASPFYFLDFNKPQGYQGAGIRVPGFEAEKVPKVSPAGLNVGGVAPLDAHLIRRDFPILNERVNGRPLIWLDNAATTQKPRQVIERLSYFYEHENSNIHRAAHELAARSTDAYEAAREKVRGFLKARSVNEIVFVRGATEAINLVAKSWGQQYIGADNEIVVSNLEHHANIVPWQQLAARTGAKIKVIPVDDTGQIRLDEYAKLLGPRTKLVSFTQVSNALGTVTPAQQMVALAHAAGAKVLVDGAQAVSHMPVDVIGLDADWYVFSGHKVFGPTGIGVLYGKENLLNATDPWQGGGNMIEDVTFEQTRYHKAPGRFEAGTGNIADAVGLGAAIDYVTAIGMEKIAAYEHSLLEYGTWLLKGIDGLRLIGTAHEKAGVLSFVLDGHKTEEIGAALNREGIAVRSGHHCAQPILRRFGVEATVRPSLAFYNTCAELDALAAAIHRIRGSKSTVQSLGVTN
ncbi:family 2A encapsulin nanocompartment cargo protein cysteine desulfurase [Denitratisoma sp. agr-D3]